MCDADYVGYKARHLFQRVTEHKHSASGNHFHEAHGRRDLLKESHFKIMRKCQGKFDCLVFEMFKLRNSNLILTCKRTPYVHNLLFYL